MDKMPLCLLGCSSLVLCEPEEKALSYSQYVEEQPVSTSVSYDDYDDDEEGDGGLEEEEDYEDYEDKCDDDVAADLQKSTTDILTVPGTPPSHFFEEKVSIKALRDECAGLRETLSSALRETPEEAYRRGREMGLLEADREIKGARAARADAEAALKRKENDLSMLLLLDTKNDQPEPLQESRLRAEDKARELGEWKRQGQLDESPLQESSSPPHLLQESLEELRLRAEEQARELEDWKRESRRQLEVLRDDITTEERSCSLLLCGRDVLRCDDDDRRLEAATTTKKAFQAAKRAEALYDAPRTTVPAEMRLAKGNLVIETKLRPRTIALTDVASFDVDANGTGLARVTFRRRDNGTDAAYFLQFPKNEAYAEMDLLEHIQHAISSASGVKKQQIREPGDRSMPRCCDDRPRRITSVSVANPRATKNHPRPSSSAIPARTSRRPWL